MVMDTLQKLPATILAKAVGIISLHYAPDFTDVKGNTESGSFTGGIWWNRVKARELIRFQGSVRLLLIAYVSMGCFLPIPPCHLALFQIVSLAIGWFFYCTVSKWAIQLGWPEKTGLLGPAHSGCGLHQLAGHTLKSRIGLLLCLSLFVVASFTVHISFALLAGVWLRWLVESQVFRLVAALNKHPLAKVKRLDESPFNAKTLDFCEEPLNIFPGFGEKSSTLNLVNGA